MTSDTLGTYNRAVWNTPEPNKEKTRTLVYDPNLSAMNPTNGGARKKRIKKFWMMGKKAAYSRLMLGHLWVALHFYPRLYNPRHSNLSTLSSKLNFSTPNHSTTLDWKVWSCNVLRRIYNYRTQKRDLRFRKIFLSRSLY